MASIAVIPARSGSKRIPMKNFVQVEGELLVNRTIKFAQSCEIFDEIIVSVDSDRSADLISRSSSAVKIHMRNEVLGSDHATTIDVVNEVIVHREVEKTAVVCCLYATSILLNKERITQGLSLLQIYRDCFIFAAQESFSNPLRMFSINTQQNTLTFLNEKYLDSNTQDLTRFYADAGQFYWATASTWTSEEQILKSTSVPLVLRKWETVDIDSPEDLEIARILVKLRGGI